MKILFKFFLLFIIFFSQSAFASPENKINYKDKLVFKDYGAWRDSQGGAGKYKVLTSDWNSCVQSCLESQQCKGIEFTTHVDPRITCELHTDVFSHVQRKSLKNYFGTVWLKQKVSVNSAELSNLPNLIVSGYQIDSATKTVTVTVKNIGRQDAGNHLTYIEMNSGHAEASIKPQSQYSAYISGVAKGASWSSGPIPFRKFFPRNGFDISVLGYANLVVIADAKNMVEESDETDNVSDTYHWIQ